MIIKLNEFVLESKKYMISRSMRIKDLLDIDDNDKKIYSTLDVKNWMIKYDFDEMSKCIIVSDTKNVFNNLFSEYRISSKDLKNKFYFDDNSKNHNGKKIEESEREIDGITFYLFVFRKGSNDKNRARQMHGFKNESDIISKNNLIKSNRYTYKWDAFGSINKSYLEEKLNENSLKYYNGEEYIDLDWSHFNEIVDDEIMGKLNWNIKTIKTKNSIDLSDFLRISGLEKNNNIIEKRYSNLKNFMLCVNFHNDSKIVEEYYILIDNDHWLSYLPDLNNEKNMSFIQNMYDELHNHKLIGTRTNYSENKWHEYVNKYSVLTSNSIIKLRFKRDSKGQLRIQCGISNNNFFDFVLAENKHFKITNI